MTMNKIRMQASDGEVTFALSLLPSRMGMTNPSADLLMLYEILGYSNLIAILLVWKSTGQNRDDRWTEKVRLPIP
jgi:hypothetical protein